MSHSIQLPDKLYEAIQAYAAQRGETPEQVIRAWAAGLRQQVADKEWSLADTASFVVMRRLGITDAFTTDHHFVQAGFLRATA